MKESHFFAMMSRMKYINRWGLMRNTRAENISEHSMDTAMLAHALAVIGNKRFGKQYNAERAAVIAMYHDASEIITGDLPTPVKYYSADIREAYHALENRAVAQLVSLLPQDLRGEYQEIMAFASAEDKALQPLIKAADKLSALVKCIEERKSGSTEFFRAEETLRMAVADMHLEEADCFLEVFLPSYALTLDEQKGEQLE